HRDPLGTTPLQDAEDAHAGGGDVDARAVGAPSGGHHARAGPADPAHRPLDLLECLGASHGPSVPQRVAATRPRSLTLFWSSGERGRTNTNEGEHMGRLDERVAV